MPNFTFSPGLWYKLYYTDNGVVIARFDTSKNGELVFRTRDGVELPYNEAIRNLYDRKELHNQ